MRTAAFMLSLAAIPAACGSAPDERFTRAGVPAEVTLLPAGFVRFEGGRIPLEEFLLRMRRRLRATHDHPGQRPELIVHTHPDVRNAGRLVARIIEDLKPWGLPGISVP